MDKMERSPARKEGCRGISYAPRFFGRLKRPMLCIGRSLLYLVYFTLKRMSL